MPGMTGFELAQIIEERKKTARVPIIFPRISTRISTSWKATVPARSTTCISRWRISY